MNTEAEAIPSTARKAKALTTQERRERMRRRVLAASSRTFHERGYADATIADILATAGGMSRRSFYEHFQSKQDVLLAIIEQAEVLIAEGLAPVARLTDPLERIDAGLEVFMTFRKDDWVRIGHESLAAGEVPRARRRALTQRFYELLSSELWEAHRQGQISRPPDPITVHALIAAVDGVSLNYHMDGRGQEIAEAVPFLQNLVRAAFR